MSGTVPASRMDGGARLAVIDDSLYPDDAAWVLGHRRAAGVVQRGGLIEHTVMAPAKLN